MKASQWLGKAFLLTLAIIAAFYAFRLFLLGAGCGEEVSSMKQFKLEIVAVRVQNNNDLSVTLKFRNPSAKHIEISYILCEVRFNNDRIGAYCIDLVHSPIVVRNFSEHSRDVPISSENIQKYEGTEIDVRVYARVKIGINYFSGVAVEDAYTTHIILNSSQLENLTSA